MRVRGGDAKYEAAPAAVALPVVSAPGNIVEVAVSGRSGGKAQLVYVDRLDASESAFVDLPPQFQFLILHFKQYMFRLFFLQLVIS